MIEEHHERFPVVGNVEQGDGFRVYAQMAPRPRFEEFFECANAARHGDEPVGEFGEHRFAFVHGVDDVQLGELAVRGFALYKCVWHDANDFAARPQRRICQRAHQSDSATTKHHGVFAFGHEYAECACQRQVRGVVARVGCAENADALHGVERGNGVPDRRTWFAAIWYGIRTPSVCHEENSRCSG